MRCLTGLKLKDFCLVSLRYERNFVKDIVDYCNSRSRNVCVVYGLRRTGKTYGMLQAIIHLAENNSWDKICFIDCNKGDELLELYDNIERLADEGVKYFFIDEITFINDFIDYSSTLANYYSCGGLRIVISGTNSYALKLASEDSLLGRCWFLNTSNISFKEFVKVTGKSSIQDFIDFGGLFAEGSIRDPFTPSGFTVVAGLREYIDSAVVENVANSIATFKDGRYTYGCDLQAIRSYVYSIILSRTHSLIDKLMNPLKLSELNGALSLERVNCILGKDGSRALKEKITLKFIDAFKYKLDITLDPSTAALVDEALVAIGLLYPAQIIVRNIREYPVTHLTDNILNPIILRTSITEWILKELEGYGKPDLSAAVKEMANGYILEEIVRFELMQQVEAGNLYTLQFATSKAFGEIDLVIQEKAILYLYEIKNSSQPVAPQSKHLRNKELLQYLTDEGYTVKDRAVLYNGETCIYNIKDEDSDVGDGISYKNITEFLLSVQNLGKLSSYYLPGVVCERSNRNLFNFKGLYTDLAIDAMEDYDKTSLFKDNADKV